MAEQTLTALLDLLAKQNIKLWAEEEQLRVQAPKGAMTPELRGLITEKKAALLAWLQADQDRPSLALAQIAVKPAEQHLPFPLTDIQYAYWLGQTVEMALQNGYHIYQEIDVPALDIPRAQQTWQRLVDYHDMLRAVILPTGQQQIYKEVPPYAITVLDLRGQTEQEQQERLLQIRTEMSHQRFELAQWPLFDLRITQLDAQQARIHVSMALITLDGSSFYKLFYTWDALYTNPMLPLPPLALSYRDYVLWTEALEATEQYQQARNYWLNRLDSLPLAPKLPLRRAVDNRNADNPQQKSHVVHRMLELTLAQWQQCKQIAQQAAVTPTALLASLFAEVLTTWSEQPQFTINCTFFNRPSVIHPQINDILGDFTTVSLLAVDHTAEAPLLDRAKQINQQLWRDLDHQTFNGVRVIRELMTKHKNPPGPLMPIVFTSMLGINLNIERKEHNTFLGGERKYSISQTPQVSLDVQIFENTEGISIVWDALEAYFPDGLIQAMFDAFTKLLLEGINHPLLWREGCSLRLPTAHRAHYTQLNDTAGDYPDGTLHELLCKQVETRGDQLAIITARQSLSYQALYLRANGVAHWLQQQNGNRPLKADTLVAIVMEKGWEQIVGVFGILMAGAAYVPIDPTLPAARRDYLLEQSEVAFVLTQSSVESTLSWPEWLSSTQRLAVDTQDGSALLPPVEKRGAPSDLAYVLYTSGSTGLPKGVMIEHRSVVNRMSDVAERFGLTAADRAIALTALHHDLSVFDIFGMLAVVGGSIVLPDADATRDPNHWSTLMRTHRVTLWNSVPAFMQMLVEQIEPLALSPSNPPESPDESIPHDLRWVILSGDFIPVSLPDRLRALLPEVELISAGGPTETTVWDIHYRIGDVEPAWASIPYGKPLKNAHYYVMDEHLQPRPLWVPGELCIGGVGLARGYWKDAEKSSTKFVTHPTTGERLYRSGDLGRLLPDGNIEILGRTDFQVKLRGQRIELGEIEAHLRQHPLIKAAVVSVVGDEPSTRQLVAYVVSNQELLAQAGTAPSTQRQADQPQQSVEALPLADLHGVTIYDPIERLTFKLEKRGIRHFQPPNRNGAPAEHASPTIIPLPKAAIDEEFQAAYLARQSYRRFRQELMPLETLSELLMCIMPIEIAAAPLPKYRYPSAGGLYPIQAYLYVKEGRVAGLPAGFYYYHPLHHQLILLTPTAGTNAGTNGNTNAGTNGSTNGSTSGHVAEQLFPGANQAIFDQAAFSLFLVADMDAIAPMYGDLARDFALLEAGYISQLLMTEAPPRLLGLCPIGGVDLAKIQDALALGSNHQLLHSLAGGRIDPHQRTEWLQETEQEAAAPASKTTWQLQLQAYLKEKLPVHMVPATYVALDELPLSANGKVDRKALPIPNLQGAVEVFVAPEKDLEKAISAILQEMLTLQQERTEVGIDHNFADLGLNSVHMVRFNQRLKESLQRQIPIAALFQHATVRTLAHYIEQSEQQTAVDQAEKSVIQTRSEQRAQARLAGRQRQRR